MACALQSVKRDRPWVSPAAAVQRVLAVAQLDDPALVALLRQLRPRPCRSARITAW